MADRHLLHAGHGAQESAEVVAVQVMAGVDAEAHAQRRLGRRSEASEHRISGRRAEAAGEGLGVELDAIRAQLGHGGHRGRLRVHEEADAHAQVLGLADQRAQPLGVLRQGPAMVGGELVFGVGHEGDLMGTMPVHEVHQVLGRVAFDVELGVGPVLQQGGQVIDVTGPDVAGVRAGMHRDALGAGAQAELGRAQHAGDAEVARVAQQRHLVDVDRQRAARAGMGKRVHVRGARPAVATHAPCRAAAREKGVGGVMFRAGSGRRPSVRGCAASGGRDGSEAGPAAWT
mmetsp:Transcript_4852/g.17273  ORF Transcript_4852/g.17273 Transcript_4852/m.17273 type:complete len:287 (+) Transcript_4852:1388-2248(+)